MNSSDLNNEQHSPDEGSPTTAINTSENNKELLRRLLTTEKEILKETCPTPKQYGIYTDQNTTPKISLFGALNSIAYDTKKRNRAWKSLLRILYHEQSCV